MCLENDPILLDRDLSSKSKLIKKKCQRRSESETLGKMGIEIRVEQLGSMMCNHISINKEKICSEWRRAHLPIIKVVVRGPQINNKGKKERPKAFFVFFPITHPALLLQTGVRSSSQYRETGDMFYIYKYI